ncbi:MAG: hypothetical protein P4L22_04055 [Candidatus Babeliales bacterium]|nr:hypothetical protein [Candidatus Babeliales bacterium]
MIKFLKIVILGLIYFINSHATTIFYNLKRPAFAAYYYKIGNNYIASPGDIKGLRGVGVIDIVKPEKSRIKGDFFKTNQRVILISNNPRMLEDIIDGSTVIQPSAPYAQVLPAKKIVSKTKGNESPTELSKRSPSVSLDLSKSESLDDFPDSQKPKKTYRQLVAYTSADAKDDNSILAIHAPTKQDYICIDEINNLSVYNNIKCVGRHFKYLRNKKRK